MIVTKLQGGLGNQIFQWAYGKSLSIKHNTELCIDTNYYKNQLGDTLRKYELDKFPNLQDIQCNQNHKSILQVTDNFNYQSLSYDNNFNYYLNGFWQSEKYFKNIEQTIKKELEPSKETIKKLKKNIKGNTISIHIRRTDYLTSNGFHPVQTIDYYKKGLEIIGEYDRLLVFSDDIIWCKNNLTFENMIFIENQDNVEDIWLMSLCNHNIIANSSFSWWGAWLNKNKNKKVIAPSNWFGNNTVSSNDIIPNEWITL